MLSIRPAPRLMGYTVDIVNKGVLSRRGTGRVYTEERGRLTKTPQERRRWR